MRVYGSLVIAVGIAIIWRGWWMIYHIRGGFAHFELERDCAAGNALIVSGFIALLAGPYFISQSNNRRSDDEDKG
jgi:hypothetical protein